MKSNDKKRSMTKEEKIAKKLEKQALKEYRKDVERLNKLLVPVSKKTSESLGILSFDSKVATIRKINNRWIKTFKIDGLNEDNRNDFIDDLMGILTIRSRITSIFSQSETGRQIRTDYLTFFDVGAEYIDVKKSFDEEVARINSNQNNIKVIEISSNCFMNQIRRNYLLDGLEVDFSALVKRNSNWRNDAYNKLSFVDDYFELSDKKGVCMQIIQYPGIIDNNVSDKLLDMNLPIMFVTDIQPLDNDDSEDFRKVLERRYNTRISTSDKAYVNVGFTIVIITDSVEQKDEVIEDVQDLFSDNGMVITPVYGNTTDIVESSFTLGLKDYHSMRSLEASQVKQLIV